MAAIGVDLDGVVYPFDPIMRDWLKRRGWGDLPPPTQWDCYEDWGMTFNGWMEEFEASIDARYMFIMGDPIEGSLKALRTFQRAGHTIHIVTHRVYGLHSVENTAIWLKMHDIPHNSLTFAADKTIIRTDFFIEDRVENYEDLRAAGVEAYLLAQPWNAHGPQEHRLENWDAFINAII